MVAWLAPAISAGASLLGGILGNQQRQQGQEREIELQKEFAQNGVRWKVEDAQRAGIHPLAALGATGASYSPVGLGDNDTAAIGSSIGQDVSRAIDATRTAPERAGFVSQKLEALGLERASLENQLLRAQIMDITRPGSPPFPMAGSDYRMPGQSSSGVDAGTIEAAGVPLKRPPGWSPASDVTNELGEPIEWLYSIPASVWRLIYNAQEAAGPLQTAKDRPIRGAQWYK